MNLEQIHSEWQKHSRIGHQLDEASKETPKLHAHYLSLLSTAKIRLKQAELDQKKLLLNKFLWYNGKLDQTEINRLGWVPDPFDGLKIMKGDLSYYYDADPEIQDSERQITYWKTIIETLKEIIDVLRWRHQTIKNILEWRRFESGD